MQWSLFSMKDEQSKSFSEKAKKVATLVSSAIVPVEVVLFYSLAFHYFQELALVLPLLTLVSSYLSIKKFTEVNNFTAICETFYSILTKAASLTFDRRVSVIIIQSHIIVHALFVASNTFITLQTHGYIPVIPEVFNNHTLQAIQSPEEFRGHLLNVTNNLMLCKDICQGVHQTLARTTIKSSSALLQRSLSAFGSMYIIVYGIFACNVVSGLFGFIIKKLTYPEERYIEVIENQEKLKKKIQGLANGCEDGEGEDVLDTWYMQIEITMQSFLDGPAGPPPDNNRLAQLLTNQENKLERKRKRLFRILNVDSQRLKKKLKQKSYF